MFGSKDKPQNPDAKTSAKPEKKGLFGWARRREEPAPAEPQADAPAPLTGDLNTVEGREAAAREAAASLFSELGQKASVEQTPEPVAEPEAKGFFARMRQGLSKTSVNLGEGMANLFLGEKEIDDELLEDMETRLLMADVGIEATTMIMETLQQRVTRRQVSSRKALYRALQDELEALLAHVAKPLEIDSSKKPYVILVVGVNGVGKTTTIGKLACRFKAEGKNVMLAAGDTFRAAAVEQLQAWGDRAGCRVIASVAGADAASLAYDALTAAQAEDATVLIVDTAGRLQNKADLMAELQKIVRVLRKLDPSAPHDCVLVLDATIGQNAHAQVGVFRDMVNVTGLMVTKLDGTARGGVVVALADAFGLPVHAAGVGEGIDDLRPFEAGAFARALMGLED